MFFDKKKILHTLSGPKVIIVNVVLGILVGIYFKPLVPYLTPIGDSLKAILMFCILPIIFITIVVSLAEVFQQGGSEKKLYKMAAVFVIGAVVVSLFSMGIVYLAKDKLHLGSQEQQILAESIPSTEDYPPSTSAIVKTDTNPIAAAAKTEKFSLFLRQMIPNNIFTAFDDGLSMKVVLLSLLIGIALGKVRSKYTDYFLDVLKVVNEIFHKIFHWILLIIPFGLLCIFADTIGNFDIKMLRAVLGLTGIFYLIGIILIAVYSTIICKKFKISFAKLFNVFKKTLLLTCATMSSTVAVPSSVEAFSTFRLDKKMMELIVPLGIVLNRQATVVLFAVVSMFSLIFYGIEITPEKICTILLLSIILGSCATGGAVVFAPMFAMMASIVGVPSIMGTTIIFASDLILLWISLVQILFANYAVVALVAQEDPQNTLGAEVVNA